MENHGAPSGRDHNDHSSRHRQHVGHEAHHQEHMRMDAGGHGAGEHDRHSAHVDHTGHEQKFRNRFWVSLVLSIPVLLYSEIVQRWLNFSMPAFPGSDWIIPIFSVVIFFYGGLLFLQMAVPEFKVKRPGMMALISLAISVAFVYSLAATIFKLGDSLYWELVTLIDVMLLGHWIEMRSVRQATGALTELAMLIPDTAERITGDAATDIVPIHRLRAGDLILVRPGGSVPADGEVVEGSSDVNEAMITGESRPVKKSTGDRVIAGTINGSGSLRVKVTATGEETSLAGIMRLVEEAQRSKSQTQILADKAAGWLFYTAVVAAALTAFAWLLVIGFEVEVIRRVTAVLVIACPHALGLAIPLVVAITTSLGASNGILVRDRLDLESAREVDVVIFDKTGTLTKGEHGVVGIEVAGGKRGEEALALAAAIEWDSEHLLAGAIRQAAQDRGLDIPAVTGFEALKGRGVRASQDGRVVYVGGPNLLESLGLEPPVGLSRFGSQAGEKGQTVVYLVEEDQVTAALALADVVRPESKQAVDRLHEMDIEVAMLTGDSEAVARSIASDLGVDRYFAEVLPEEKDKKVTQLQEEGKHVAMVGDGVNDAPALVRADVGIAIGSGTDVAIESAGVILVKSNPLDVVKVIELSKASYRKMVQNLIWATGYNLAAIPLAAGVLAPFGILLSPAVGAILMSLSTVIVAINAQLLRRTLAAVV